MTQVGASCISNKVEYRERLTERIDSSLQDTELVFAPYDTDQLRAILESQADRFEDSVRADDIMPKIAALSAEEHAGYTESNQYTV